MANKALSRAYDGKPWRGHYLEVRTVKGRGGRSGIQYEVNAASLPDDLRMIVESQSKAVQTVSKSQEHKLLQTQKAEEGAKFKLSIITPLLNINNTERTARIRELNGTEVLWPDGNRKSLNKNSLYRWLKAYETEGIAGLYRKQRSDKGEMRVFITREWDKAVPFDDETKERIAKEHKANCQTSLIKGEALGQTQIVTREWLIKITRENGFNPGREELEKICSVPEQHVLREFRCKKVAQKNRDNTGFEHSRARAKRTLEGLKPMDIVVGDVHPIDNCILRRDDPESKVNPRAIAWIDVATNVCLRTDVFFPEKGCDVTNTVVLTSFFMLVKEFGMMKTLYIDNGSEYNFAYNIKKLVHLPDLVIRDVTFEHNFKDYGQVKHANPYNPQSKPIEGFFGNFTRNYYSSMQGYIGGDRMKKKTSNHGKEMEPYQGSYDDFRQEIEEYRNSYNLTPHKKGNIKGSSPRRVWNEFIRNSWTTTSVDDESFMLAFCRKDTRIVTKGMISVNGIRYYHPNLHLWNDRRVTIGIPEYIPWNNILLFDEHDKLEAVLTPEKTFKFNDPEGAKQSQLYRKDALTVIKSIENQQNSFNPREYRQELIKNSEPMIVPEGRSLPENENASLLRTLLPSDFSFEARQKKEERQLELAAQKEDAAYEEKVRRQIELGNKFKRKAG